MGHNWPVYFGFKGGKGALTAAAVLFMLDWVMALIGLAAALKRKPTVARYTLYFRHL
jgi:glycerol-3-phosphate acyltransferase PlsY